MSEMTEIAEPETSERSKVESWRLHVLIEAGYPLSAVTEALCTRWKPGVRLLPATDDRAETHVVLADGEGRLLPLRSRSRYRQR